MIPFVCIDTETTGLPKSGYEPVIVEVGAVVVTGEGLVKNPIGFFVKHDKDVLYDPKAKRAFEITGISREQVLEEGLEEEAAAERLAEWVERIAVRYGGDLKLRAFNQAFDFRFLGASPWDIFDRTKTVPGECIMEAAMGIMGPAGALPPAPEWAKAKGAEWKWPSLTETISYLNGRGHEIRWGSQAHRAQEDALQEAMVAVAIEAERNGWTP